MIITQKKLQCLKQCLGKQVDRIAIFGSATYKDLNEVNDIDILLFVDPSKFCSVREHIFLQNLAFVSHIEKIMCNYTKLPETNKPNGNLSEKPIHIAFLPNNEIDYSQTTLWRKNQHNIQFI